MSPANLRLKDSVRYVSMRRTVYILKARARFVKVAYTLKAFVSNCNENVIAISTGLDWHLCSVLCCYVHLVQIADTASGIDTGDALCA